MFKKVKKGDIFKPNAGLTNETIKVINAYNSINGFRAGTRRKNTTNIEVLVKPSRQTTLFSPIRIIALNSEPLSDNNLFAKHSYTIVPATDEFKDYPLAILQNNAISSTLLIPALVMGVSPAKITINDEDHMYADTTNAGKFESVESGPVRILHQPGGTGEKWCTVLIGAGGGASGDTYNGYFKVIQTATDKIKIVDGLDIDSTVAGQISVNRSTGVVCAKEITVSILTVKYIWLECILSFTGGLLSAEIKYGMSLPSAGNGIANILISRIKYLPTGLIEDFSQESVPSYIGINFNV